MGTTDFREVAEFIDDDSDEERAQDSAEEPEPAARESPSGGTAAGPKQEGETEHFTLSPEKAGRGSPTKSDATHPEDLLSAAPKNTAGKEKEDRGQPNCSESGSGRLMGPGVAAAHLGAPILQPRCVGTGLRGSVRMGIRF